MREYKEFIDFLLEENQKYNLTAITDRHEIQIKHIEDSLSIADYVHGRVVDIGSGAGFPAMILKLNDKSLDITMIDSVLKKVNFLNEAIKRLKLKNIRAIHSRIEDYAHQEFESFDTVTSRALSNMSTLMELSLPLLKIGGCAICMKGLNLESELKASANAIEILGGKISDVKKIDIKGNTRHIVIVEKVRPTDRKYPRSNNKPLRRPL